jgi:hypothetical protein
MAITERMVEIKNKLVEADREKTTEALAEYIYRSIAPRAKGKTKYSVFESDGQEAAFRKGAQIESSSLAWLFDRMEEEGLLEKVDSVSYLTALGIKALCQP